MTVPVPVCSGPPATQMEYLSLLLELRADPVLSVGLFVPMQRDGSVTVSPTAMWQWGQEEEGVATWGPSGALSGLPSAAPALAKPQGVAGMKM